jgi:3-deoxy-D-manno-octulosonic-acid transferase
MIYLYKIVGIILIPIVKINIKIRIILGKELKSRYKERYGITNYPLNKNKKIIWIHAASVGEFKSADYFIQKYYKSYTVLITTTTVSAAKYADNYYEGKVIHQFAPFDITPWIKNFLKYWNPSFIIWIESDLWPATLSLIKKQKRRSILVNARISPKSFNKWKIIPTIYSEILSSFFEIFAQSKIDQKRINFLTKRNIKYIGNLKFFKKELDPRKLKNLNYVKQDNGLTLMLASTHFNEEDELLPIIKDLIKNYNQLQIIIAPRHPERAKQIMQTCSSYKLKSHLESEKKEYDKSIVIINSFGILSKYFALSDIVFLGGSLISAGGHNPIEPALQKCIVITGPKIFNWQNIFEEMEEEKACIRINTKNDFKKNINDLINNKDKREAIKKNAYKFAQKQFVNTEILEKIINDEINIMKC